MLHSKFEFKNNLKVDVAIFDTTYKHDNLFYFLFL